MTKTFSLLICILGPVVFSSCQHSLLREKKPDAEARGPNYAVATQGVASTKATQAILSQGGNLVDAAVAASFVISVERPHSTGLSGGGFFLFREASTEKIYAIDFRERAPLKATEKMFIGPDGKVDVKKAQDSIFSSGVPGLVAGLYEIHQRFGKLPWAQLVKPAQELAENGFVVYPALAAALKDRAGVLGANPAAKKIFFKNDGQPLQSGDLLVQKDLAWTLGEIAKNGRSGFYEGPVAKKILEYFKKERGLITAKDFSAYKVKWREPLRGQFHGYDVVSMPPPSSGGVHVLQFLNFLEKDPLNSYGYLSSKSIHLAASGLQAAFADRAKYLGDADFVKVPVQGLISPAYSQQRRQEVSLDKARSSDQVAAGNPLPYESSETTHFSMMDQEGNMIASTQTINGWMGSGLVVPETGLVLNNEMDDFSAQEGASNLFGAVGGKQNAIQAQKTPLSSMSPTLVLKSKKPVLAVGAPGGTRIISCVAQTILNVLEFKRPLYEAVAGVRYHHQWRPDVLQIDPPGPSAKVLEELQKMGYKVELKPVGCNVMAVSRDPQENILTGVADPRDIGTSAAQ